MSLEKENDIKVGTIFYNSKCFINIATKVHNAKSIDVFCIVCSMSDGAPYQLYGGNFYGGDIEIIDTPELLQILYGE